MRVLTPDEVRLREPVPVAVLRREPADLPGVAFRRETDDLDDLLEAVVDVDGQEFLLTRHAHQPQPGVAVSVGEGAPTDVGPLLRALSLGLDDVQTLRLYGVWVGVRPAATA